MSNLNLKFIKNDAVLCFDGYRYNFVRRYSNQNSFWRCSNRSECSASLTLNADKTAMIVRKKESLHCCEKNIDKMHRELVLETAKKNVCENMSAVKKNYEKAVMDFVNLNPSASVQMQPFEAIKDTLHRKRRKYLDVAKTEFTKSIDVCIPELIKKDFLVCEYELDTQNKIIVFCSRTCRGVLKSCADQGKVVFGDGTFKTVPSPFYQMFTIFVDINSCNETTNVKPMIYALMPNKTARAYTALFTIVRDILHINVKSYKCDFEMAQISACRGVFPGVKLSGCFFHYTKAIEMNAVKTGLTEVPEGRRMVTYIKKLPLLPKSLIPQAWEEIIEKSPGDNMTDFKKYFERQWLKNPSLISCCKERHRTTNALEAWHRRIGVRFHQKPTLVHFLYCLRKEARFQDLVVRGHYFP